MVDIVADSFSETLKSMNGGTSLFEAKLIMRSGEKVFKNQFERVLEQFGQNRRDGNTPVICCVRFVALDIFYDWNHEARSEILWDKSMRQHHVEQD